MAERLFSLFIDAHMLGLVVRDRFILNTPVPITLCAPEILSILRSLKNPRWWLTLITDLFNPVGKAVNGVDPGERSSSQLGAIIATHRGLVKQAGSWKVVQQLHDAQLLALRSINEFRAPLEPNSRLRRLVIPGHQRTLTQTLC